MSPRETADQKLSRPAPAREQRPARLVITRLSPSVAVGAYPSKRVINDIVSFAAIIVCDGAAVKAWLLAHQFVPAGAAINGAGEMRPVAPNTKPDGSDDPAGRQRNRRVDVVIDTGS